MTGLEPTRAVLKQLMVLTNNCCAFQDPVTGKACESHLYKPGWKQVNADMCHIRGDSPGSARHDESMSPEDRRSFDNLIVLCPNHHNIIDNVRPDDFTVEVLEDMKIRAESRAESVHHWVPETAIDPVIDLVAARTQYLFSLAPMPQVIGLSAEIRGEAAITGTASI